MNDPLISEGRIAVKKCRHGLFMYNQHDQFIGRGLALYGEWCEAELEGLLQIVRPGDIVLDIGANIGTHTVPLARKVATNGAVFAFEPQRVVFQILCGNVALNGLPNVQCLQNAVGAKRGTIGVPALNQDIDQNFGGLKLADRASDRGEPTELIALDDLDLPSCRLIKIDVEGMEAAVLAGARETIRKHRPLLFVENNRIDTSRGILEAVAELDYAAWWHISPYFNPQNFFGNTENIYEGLVPEANLLCLPKSSATTVAGLPPALGLDDNWRKALERQGMVFEVTPES